MPGSRRATLKRIAFFTIMLLGSVLVALLVAEGAARAWSAITGDDGQRHDDWQSQTQSMFRSHLTRSYAHVPYYHGRVRYRGQVFAIDLNALGMRTDAEQPLQPEPAAYTILGLGDSQTFGWGVEARECYPARLERLLVDSTGVRARALNAGVIGYGTDQEADALRELGPVLRPNLVIVGFFANDILDGAMPKRIVRYGLLMNDYPAMKRVDLGALRHHPAFVRRNDRLAALLDGRAASPDERAASRRRAPSAQAILRHSLLYRMVARQVEEDDRLSAWLVRLHLLDENRAAQYQQLTLLEFGVFLESWPDLYAKGWARVQESLLQIADRANALGADLLVLNIPYPFEVDERLWQATAERYSFDARGFDVHKPSRLLAAFCRTHGIQHLDLLPAFRRAAGDETGEPLFFKRDAHLTARGHELIAQHLIRYFTAHRLLPMKAVVGGRWSVVGGQ